MSKRKQFAELLEGPLEAMPEPMQHRVIALGAARIISLSGVPGHTVKTAESFDLVELARFITGESVEVNGGDRG